jgi:phage gpG-like protein
MPNKNTDLPTPDFRKIAEEVMKDLPKKAGEKALQFFLASFIKQGFTDTSFIPWVKRKDDLSHKLLNQSYALKASGKIDKADLTEVIISFGEGLNYAAIHNEGGTITVKVSAKMKRFFWYMYKKTEDEKWKWMALTKNETLTIKIPKRQYIGGSETLMNNLDKMFIDRIKQYFNSLK